MYLVFNKEKKIRLNLIRRCSSSESCNEYTCYTWEMDRTYTRYVGGWSGGGGRGGTHAGSAAAAAAVVVGRWPAGTQPVVVFVLVVLVLVVVVVVV